MAGIFDIGAGVGAVVNGVGNVITSLVTTDKDRMAYDLENRKLDQVIDLAQTEVNKVEAASSNWFVAGWRPAAGWVCVGGLAYQLMFRPIFGWIMKNALSWDMPPSLEIDTLMTLLFGMLGLGAYRTIEKSKKVA